jgi:hypothetical protein
MNRTYQRQTVACEFPVQLFERRNSFISLTTWSPGLTEYIIKFLLLHFASYILRAIFIFSSDTQVSSPFSRTSVSKYIDDTSLSFHAVPFLHLIRLFIVWMLHISILLLRSKRTVTFAGILCTILISAFFIHPFYLLCRVCNKICGLRKGT